MESKLQGALYFEIFENHILKFQKLLRKMLNVDKCCTLPTCKITNQNNSYSGLHKNESDRLEELKFCTIHYFQMSDFVIFTQTKIHDVSS